jgi:hypothetical protein
MVISYFVSNNSIFVQPFSFQRILKMEEIRSYETSAHRRSALRHIPEDGILQYFKYVHVSLLVIIRSITIDYNTRIPSKNNAPEYVTITKTYPLYVYNIQFHSRMIFLQMFIV